ncbi:Aste57867_1256 [Aphanomyces stellatus]|uniref:Aste57867_1256 protein n=1 Tax=Aphanomyces stellatus TaxID=120398 RepID=A0A485KA74_9STRA|nr:hypothetical protein As57867_001255 [Aphanomyces stellatus]VFT78475.1 Aste57867_1256 [Aphanomyces stellatus]
MKCYLRCFSEINTSKPVNYSSVFQELQAIRILLKAFQSIMSNIANTSDEQKVEDYWKCLRNICYAVFRYEYQHPFDEQYRNSFATLLEDVLTCAQSSLSQDHSVDMESTSSRFGSCLLKLVFERHSYSHVMCLQNALLILAYTRNFVSPTQGDKQHLNSRCGYLLLNSCLRAFESLSSLIGSGRNTTLLQFLIEPAVLLLTQSPASKILQVEFMNCYLQAKDSERYFFNAVWTETLIIWNKHFPIAGDQFVSVLLDYIVCIDSRIDSNDRLAACELLSILFPHMEESQKLMCISIFADTVEPICSDGPYHTFNLTVSANIQFLDNFVRLCEFLNHIESASRNQFIETYLYMCYECCGTAVRIAAQEAKDSNSIDEGIWRVIDSTLLVLRAIFARGPNNYYQNEEDQPYVEEVRNLLVPLLNEILDVVSTRDVEHITTNRIASTSLFMVKILNYNLKKNVENYFFNMLKSLVQLSFSSQTSIVVSEFMIHISNIQIPLDNSDMEIAFKQIMIIYYNLIANCDWPVISVGMAAFYEFLSKSNLTINNTESIRAFIRSHVQKMHKHIEILSKDDKTKTRPEWPASPATLPPREILDNGMINSHVTSNDASSNIDYLWSTCLQIKNIHDSKISAATADIIPSTELNNACTVLQELLLKMQEN